MDTGWAERSQRFYKQDYGRAIERLNKWINRGKPEGITERPLFKEVRQGHLQAMKQLNVLDTYGKDFFQRTPDKLRARWRSYYSHEPKAKSPRDSNRNGRTKWQAPSAELALLMLNSRDEMTCFGCGQPLGEGERYGRVTKFGKENLFHVHAKESCCRKAAENFKAGLE